MTDKQSKLPNIRINKVYTRTGDAGKTRLIGGAETWKDNVRVEAFGTVDELNAEIGLCRELLKETGNEKFTLIVQTLKSVQNELFNLGTQLASATENHSKNLPRLSNDAILQLETEIDNMNESLSELTSFVLPGGSVLNAQFHMARNVCRRAERRTITLSKKETVDPKNIKYLNRLSDALFVWSRYVNKENHVLASHRQRANSNGINAKGNQQGIWEDISKECDRNQKDRCIQTTIVRRRT